MNHLSISEYSSSKASSFFDFRLKSLYVLGTFVLGLYLVVQKTTVEENPLAYIILAILAFYTIIYTLNHWLTKKVTKFSFESDRMNISYKYFASEQEYSANISDISIALFESKNHQSASEGIAIKLTDNSEQKVFKLLSQHWSYTDLEAIYAEFKKRKNESIPETDKAVWQQLQIINQSKQADLR